MALSNDFMRQSGLGGELEIIYLLLTDIIVKDQIRKDFKDIDSLATSIRELGLQNPLVVMKKDGEFVLNQGERRYRALSLLVEQGFDDFNRVACHIIDFDSDENEFMRQFSENFSRSDLTCLEYADAIIYYRDNFDNSVGWKGRFSEKYGVSPSFVSRHLKLSDAPHSVKDLCLSGVVTSVQRLNQISDLDNCEDVVSLINGGSSFHDAINLVVGDSDPAVIPEDDTLVNDSPVADKNEKSSETGNQSPALSKTHIDALISYVMKKNNITDVESLIAFIEQNN